MNPIISIIIPLYNNEAYIEQCLRSVYAQTEPCLQIIIVDDASSDSSLEICRKRSGDCPESMELYIHAQAENQGLSAARNAGIERARGKYIYFLDSDDWIPTDSMAVLLRAAEKHDAEVCYGQLEYFQGDQVAELQAGREPACELIDTNAHILKLYADWDVNRVIICNRLIRRSFINDNELLCQEGLQFAEDNLLSFIFAVRSECWVHVADTTYYYRKDNASSITTTYSTEEVLLNYYFVLGKMIAYVEKEGNVRSDSMNMAVQVLHNYKKTILWNIESQQGTDVGIFYKQLSKCDGFKRNRLFYKYLGVKNRLFTFGWSLPFPLNRVSCPYYLAKLKSRRK